MRVEIDTHTHTLASGHAYNTMNEMAKAAADKGLKRPCDYGTCTGDARDLSFILFSEFKDCSEKEIWN